MLYSPQAWDLVPALALEVMYSKMEAEWIRSTAEQHSQSTSQVTSRVAARRVPGGPTARGIRDKNGRAAPAWSSWLC